jgi:hypothetical protein
MKLNGFEIDYLNLSDFEKSQMFKIMENHYENMIFEKFLKDLSEKDKIFILIDEKENIKGFTTIKFMDFNIENKKIKGVFSGDTIVDKDVGFEIQLQKMWVNFIFKYLKANPQESLYWFLICKGYRTYGFLPMYFKKYYPNYEYNTPAFEKSIMDNYAFLKYGKNYDKTTGIIYNDGSNDYLKDDVAPVTERKLKNPVVKFFVEKNPGYVNGDELVCLAQFSFSNFKDVFERMLR